MIIRVIIVIISIALFLLLESSYCLLRRRKDLKRFRVIGDIDNDVKFADHSDEARDRKGTFLRYCIFSFIDSAMFFLFKITGYIPLHFVRKFFYRFIFHIRIGRNVVIYYGLETRCPWNIEIGDGSIIGDRCILDARYGIKVGNNVNISSGVWMWSLQHDVNSATFSSDGQGGMITIGDRAWVSSRVNILPGIKVAEGCVVACGAVVTRDCSDDYSVYGGIPAKKIGSRNPKLTYEFDGKHRWFI